MEVVQIFRDILDDRLVGIKHTSVTADVMRQPSESFMI